MINSIKKSLTFFLIFLPFVSFSSVKSDSIISIWKNTALSDSVRMQSVLKNGYYISVNHSDQLIENSEPLLSLAQNNKAKKIESAIYNYIGIAYDVKGISDSSKINFLKSIEILEEIDDSVRLASSYGNIAIAYLYNNEFLKAIDYNLKSIQYCTLLKDSSQLANGKDILANIFSEVEDFEAAETYYLESLSIFQALGDQESIDRVNSNLASVYFENQQYEKAKKLYETAIITYKKFEENRFLGITYYSLSSIYKELDKQDSAQIYARKAIATLSSHPESKYLILSYHTLGELLLTSDLDSSLLLGKTALDINGEEEDQLLNNRPHYNLLYKAYKLKGDNDKALKMLEKYQAASAIFYNDQELKAIQRKAIAFEFKMKQQLAEAAFNRKEDQIQYEKRVTIIVIISAFIILILLLATLHYKRVQKHTLEKQQLLEQLNQLKKNLSLAKKKTDVDMSISSELEKEKIDQATEAKLNDTDWKIIYELYHNPSLTNNEISDNISLSYHGVNYSLKKMYALLNLEGRRNKKLNLIVELVKLSK